MATFTTNQFNGGMNDWISPSLLGKNMSQYLADAHVDNGKIGAEKEPKLLTLTDPTKFGHYGSKDRSTVKFYGRYYWSENNRNSSPYYSGDVENLGVTYPSVLPTLAEDGVGILDGTYNYCMTYVNTNGWESAPGGLSGWKSSITVASKKVKITAPATFPTGIVKVKVYRTVKEGADFYGIGEIATAGGTLSDNTTDLDLVFGNILDTEDDYPPPDGGKYLTENGGVFYLAVGDRLYFSRQGNPHAWPTLNWIGVNDIITGISKEFQGVLVFTVNSTSRVVGADDIATITVSKIPGDQGCINWRSISQVSNMPVWLSNDGLCAWDGSTLSLISKGVLKTEHLQVSFAASANDTYYLFLVDGAIVFDRRNGNVFRKLSVSCEYAWYDGDADKLYMQESGKLYEYGAGVALTYTYLSPYIGGSELTNKRFNELIITCAGAFDIEVFLEDVSHFTLSIPTGGNKRIKLPFTTCGRNISVQIKSKYELKELAVSF